MTKKFFYRVGVGFYHLRLNENGRKIKKRRRFLKNRGVRVGLIHNLKLDPIFVRFFSQK